MIHYYDRNTMVYTACWLLPHWVETTDDVSKVTCGQCKAILSEQKGRQMNAQEAMRRLRLGYIAADSLELIQVALDLAAQALKVVEWHTWEDGEYCIWCGVGKHLDHYSNCPRQLALLAIGEKVGT